VLRLFVGDRCSGGKANGSNLLKQPSSSLSEMQTHAQGALKDIQC
jgi:hypothetical protein